MQKSELQIKSKIKNCGIATLPTVMVLGVLSLAVAVGITAVALTESFISQGSAQSSRALFYAESGARDALMRIARNKNYTCATTDCYSIDFSTNRCSTGNDCARVSVSGGTGTSGNPKIIVSRGIMRASARTMEVQVVFDISGNGEISSVSWNELTG